MNPNGMVELSDFGETDRDHCGYTSFIKQLCHFNDLIYKLDERRSDIYIAAALDNPSFCDALLRLINVIYKCYSLKAETANYISEQINRLQDLYFQYKQALDYERISQRFKGLSSTEFLNEYKQLQNELYQECGKDFIDKIKKVCHNNLEIKQRESNRED